MHEQNPSGSKHVYYISNQAAEFSIFGQIGRRDTVKFLIEKHILGPAKNEMNIVQLQAGSLSLAMARYPSMTSTPIIRAWGNFRAIFKVSIPVP